MSLASEIVGQVVEKERGEHSVEADTWPVSRSRLRTMTEKGKEWRLAQLKGKRKALSSQLTVKSNILRSLFENENLELVKEKALEWDDIYAKFVEAHNEYCLELSGELLEPDIRNWFGPKNDKHQAFRNNIEQWIRKAEQRLEQRLIDMAISPNDSVSQVGTRKTSRCRTKKSFTSRSKITQATSVSSARIKEEARKAELMARAAMLKQKQALENEEQRVRQMKEEFYVQSEMAVVNAKVKVYEQFEDGDDEEQSYRNGMNRYFEEKRTGASREVSATSNEVNSNVKRNTQEGRNIILPDLSFERQQEHSMNRPSIQASLRKQRTFEHSKSKGNLSQRYDEDDGLSREINSGGPISTSEQAFQRLMQQQNEITMKLIDQQMKSTLPPIHYSTMCS